MTLRIWTHLLKKSLMENFILCALRFKEEKSQLHYRLKISTPYNVGHITSKYQESKDIHLFHSCQNGRECGLPFLLLLLKRYYCYHRCYHYPTETLME